MLHRRLIHVSIVFLLRATASLLAEDNVAAKLDQATAELATEKYELRYRFTRGETIRYRVEHLATVDTRIAGNTQKTKSRSTSTKAWTITAATDRKMSFVHAIEDVDMFAFRTMISKTR